LPDANGNLTAQDMWNFEVQFEGSRVQVYDDQWGNATVGVGHALTRNSPNDINNLPDSPDYNSVLDGSTQLTSDQISALFNLDMGRAIHAAEAVVGGDAWDALPLTAQMAAADVAFNAGGAGLARQADFVTALRDDDVQAAAQALASSPWANRAADPSRVGADVVLTDPDSFLQELFSAVHDAVQAVLQNAPDLNTLMNWEAPGDPGNSDSGAINLNEAGPGASEVSPSAAESSAGPDESGYVEAPGWDGGALGDPGAYPGSSGDGFNGNGSEASGGPAGYGEGGTYGGGEAGSGESGGQFGGGEGGYEGAGGYGGYGAGDGEGANSGGESGSGGEG
jgi:GH24 family phage-related lysozyme (muramidase)